MEEQMKRELPFMKIVGAILAMAAIMLAARARAAVTVFAQDVPSNSDVVASVPAVETNPASGPTNQNWSRHSGGGNPDVRIDDSGIHIGGPDGINIGKSPGMAGFAMTLKYLIPIISVICVFGMPVAIILVAGYFHHRRNRLAHETIRAMIEKGMPVTPELVAELKGQHQRDGTHGRSRGRSLFPGLVLAGIGGALLIGGHGGDHKAGLIVLFIGIAFLVAWLVERQNQNNTQPPKL
jgi:hypothetical protein